MKQTLFSGSKKTSITALRLCLEPVIYKSKLLDSKHFTSLVLDAFLKPFKKYVVFLETLFIKTVIAIQFLFLFSCTTAPPVLKISSQQDMVFSIVTYSNFGSDTILQGQITANGLFKTPISHQGFALLTIDNTFPYPLLFGTENIHLDFSRPGVAPEIKESKENRFFYGFYANYNRLNSSLRMYGESIGNLGENDPLCPTLIAQIDSVKQQKELLVSDLPNKAFPVASAILQEKIIEESSWGVNSIVELHKKQKEITGFAASNYPYLKNSEQLSALIRQSFMMLEYINYYENIEKTGDKKTDIGKAKDLFRSEMLKQTQMWMDALKPYIAEPIILAQCVKAYYNRSMTGKAIELLSTFKEQAKCDGAGEKQINFPTTFDIVKNDGHTIMDTQQPYQYKLIVMVDNDCIFSKVLAIKVAREYEKNPIPIILMPKSKLDAEILAMDKLCVKDLYFVKEKDWVLDDILEGHKYPYFIMLDATNKIIMESGDLRDFDKWQ